MGSHDYLRRTSRSAISCHKMSKTCRIQTPSSLERRDGVRTMKNTESSEDRLELPWPEERRIEEITCRLKDRHRGYNHCWYAFYDHPPLPPKPPRPEWDTRIAFWDHTNDFGNPIFWDHTSFSIKSESKKILLSLCVEPHMARLLTIHPRPGVEYKSIQAMNAHIE